MKRRISGVFVVLALAVIVGTFAGEARADKPNIITEPPAANVVGLGACDVAGGATVPAGQPFVVRLGGWDGGLYGVMRDVIAKDNSTLTVERPVGTPIPAAYVFQGPFEFSPNAWFVYRWSEVYTLAAGEQMAVTMDWSLKAPWMWIFPASYPPDDFGFPPPPKPGPVFGPLLFPAGLFADPLFCTITGV